MIDGFTRLMSRFEAQSANIPESHLIQLRYEDFVRAPLEELRKAWTQLDLGSFETSRPAVAAYLDSVSTYRKNDYTGLTLAEMERIEDNWGPFFERWKYERPSEADH